MNGRAVINIGFCADHYKGGDGRDRQHGQTHWEWLEQAIELLFDITMLELPIFVSITGFRGFESVLAAPGNQERDVLWRIFSRPYVRLITMADNPGHQVGAAWCIRLGLEAAHKLHYDYMIQTAEDVVPTRGAIEQMIGQLQRGAEFISEEWGEAHEDCSAQFFACRTRFLGAKFDPCAVNAHGHIERYLRVLLEGKRVVKPGGCGLQWGTIYRTTHDMAQWQRWAQEERAK